MRRVAVKTLPGGMARMIDAAARALLLLILLCGVSQAAEQERPPGVTSVWASREERNMEYFTDLPVITHEGEELRFYSDILKDRVAIISFFYTRCSTAQPALISLFKLQSILGERLGKEVVMLSISVDPERDQGEVLSGWFLLNTKSTKIRRGTKTKQRK